MTLADLGWNPFFEDAFAPHKKAGLVPARLLRDNNLTCGALLGDGDEFDDYAERQEVKLPSRSFEEMFDGSD